MGNLSQTYWDVYKDINYGPILTAHGLLAAMDLSKAIRPNAKVLCVGCGNAYEAVHLKDKCDKVVTVDYHAPKVNCLSGNQIIGDCSAIPIKDNYFDVVLCCEMLEHVPEEKAYDCLSELYRVGKNRYRFTIADKLDPYGDLHLCVKDVGWWRSMMKDIGYNVFHIEIMPHFILLLKTPGSGEPAVKDWYYPSGYLFDATKN